MLTSSEKWQGTQAKRLALAIIFFALAVLALLWGALFYEIHQEKARALREARRDTTNLVAAFREHIRHTLTAIDQIMLAITAEYRRDPDHYSLPEWLHHSAFLTNIAIQVSIIGPDGLLLRSNLKSPVEPLDLSDRAHFRYALDPSAPQPYISAPVIGRQSGKWSIQVSRRLERADGTFAGALVVSLDPSYLTQLFGTVDLGQQGILALVGRDGIVRVRSAAGPHDLGQDVSSALLFQHYLREEHGSITARSSVDGIERVYCFAAVPGFPLIVSAGVGLDEILADPHRAATADLMFGSGVSLVVLLLTALLLQEVRRSQRRERKIFRQASLLTTILDVTPAAIWVKDEQGRYEIVNDATAQVLGRPKEDIIGRHSADILPTDFAAMIAGWDDAAGVEPGVTTGGEHQFQLGGKRQSLLTFRRACDIGGRSLMVGSAMDVTPLRRAQEELRYEVEQRIAAEAELRQAQKMEAVGRLTGGVAHDFNNLLTSVLGNIELAQRRMRHAPTLRLLRNAQRSAERGAELVQHLLAFARKQHLQTQAIELNRLIVGMMDLLDHTIGSLTRVEIEQDPELWPALGDANQIEVAILNIVINARDAMPGGGLITIRTANVAAGAPALPRDVPDADYVVITVCDTGTGMSDDVRAKAFDPFFTTKDIGKGSGLGLSQVYGMARQSGGTATIESSAGRGTSVRLYLPRAAASARQQPLAPASALRPLHCGAAILVLDDDAEIRAFVAASLGEIGHRVSLAGDCRSALDVLESGPIDVLIADILLPQMMGTDLAALARQRHPHLAILHITGFAEALAEAQMRDANVLMKPFTAAKLIAEIDRLLGGAR